MKTESRARPRATARGLVAALALTAAAMGPAPGERTEVFRADPGWDGYRNHEVPSPAPVTRQDFGHRASNRAGGKEPGEIGGRIQRSATPAWYAKVITTRTFEDRLMALQSSMFWRMSDGDSCERPRCSPQGRAGLVRVRFLVNEKS